MKKFIHFWRCDCKQKAFKQDDSILHAQLQASKQHASDQVPTPTHINNIEEKLRPWWYTDENIFNQMAIDTVFAIPYVRASPGCLVPCSAMGIKFTDHVISPNQEISSTPFLLCKRWKNTGNTSYEWFKAFMAQLKMLGAEGPC
jgi:hypothetical protein